MACTSSLWPRFFPLQNILAGLSMGHSVAQNLAQLYQAARPGDDGECHTAALLLQHGHQRRVAHACRREAIDRHDHITTPRVTTKTRVSMKYAQELTACVGEIMELHNVQLKRMATIRGLKIQLKDGRKCSIKPIYHQAAIICKFTKHYS